MDLTQIKKDIYKLRFGVYDFDNQRQRVMSIEDENKILNEVQQHIINYGEQLLPYIISDKGKLVDSRLKNALKQSGVHGIQELLPVWMDEIQSVSDGGLEYLLTQAVGEDVPEWVIATLKTLRLPHAFETLKTALEQAKRQVARNAILFAIGASGDERAIEFIVTYGIYHESIEAIAQSQNQFAVDALCDIVISNDRESNKKLGIKYLCRLFNLAPEQIADTLQKVIINPDESQSNRQKAIQCLGQLEDPIVINRLVEASTRIEDKSLRKTIYSYFKSDQFLNYLEKIESNIPPPLILSLKENQKREYVLAMQKTTSAKHRLALVALAGDTQSDYYIRKRAIRALQQLDISPIKSALITLQSQLTDEDKDNNLHQDIANLLNRED